MIRAKRRRKDGTGYAAKASRGERPFSYSSQYEEWRAAVAKGDDARINAADANWARFHAPWRGRPSSAGVWIDCPADDRKVAA